MTQWGKGRTSFAILGALPPAFALPPPVVSGNTIAAVIQPAGDRSEANHRDVRDIGSRLSCFRSLAGPAARESADTVSESSQPSYSERDKRLKRAKDLLESLSQLEALKSPTPLSEPWVIRAIVVVQATPLVARETKSRSLLWVLLRYDDGWLYFAMSCLFLIYNFARAYLTYAVGPLREAEDRSGWSPHISDYRNLLSSSSSIFDHVLLRDCFWPCDSRTDPRIEDFDTRITSARLLT